MERETTPERRGDPPSEEDEMVLARIRMAPIATVAIVGAFLVAGSAFAGVVTQRYEFNEPVVKSAGDYVSVQIAGAWHYGDPGAPILPMMGARILLPPGEIVTDVTIVPGEKLALGDGFIVEPGQMQYPLSFTGPINTIVPNSEIYNIRGAYPGRTHDEEIVGSFRGYSIANIALHPVEYIPETGSLSYYSSMDVVVTTAPEMDARHDAERMIRHDESTMIRVERMVDNTSDLLAYGSLENAHSGSRALDPADAYTYLIITTESWDGYLDTLVDFQTTMGRKANVFLSSWIQSNYTGVDEQDQIRNFIIDAYATWDVEYVLLVGDARDANGIPHRGLYSNTAYGESDADIPADLYYSCLDGNWNTDGDAYWGEPGEDDLYPEIGVGRACASTSTHVQNFVTKVMRYVNSPIVSESDEALMVGELLWSSPLTYGGTYKNEVKNGSSANGYTTVGFPGTMTVGTLYDMNGTWSKSTLISLMENGMNIVNHLGHCDVQYSAKMTNSDIPSFDNDGTVHTYNFFYSQGCYNGSFDNRTTSVGGYTGDCFSEAFNCDDDGAVACVTNSRYGWGDPGGTNGSSQFFDREFYDAMFAENIYPLGFVNSDSKVDVIWNINYGANRWCYYELNLFGDPAMDLWTASPIAMSVSHPSGMVVGQPDISVTVSDGSRAAVEGAVVTAYYDDYSVYATGVTNAAGQVTLSPDPQVPGTLYIKVNSHDRLVWTGDLEVAPASGPYVVYNDNTVDDDTTGESNGNDNAIANAGETVELPTTLENVGSDPATNVRATLSTANSYATITDDYEEYGDIAAAATALSYDDYCVVIASDAPDGEIITFDLAIESDDARMSWLSGLSVQVSAPELVYAAHEASDAPSNGNGCLEAGETVDISVSLLNDGSARATGLTVTISTTDPYIQMNDGTEGLPFINAGEVGEFTDFSITLLPSTPDYHTIDFDVDIVGDWGYASSTSFSISTAGSEFVDDIESGQGEWTHGVVTGGFVDQWHIDTYRSHTTSHSWKFGGTGSSNYADSADGALYTQELCVGASGEMTMWHWLDAEEESSSSAWDGALVQITDDGGAVWDVLTPAGGYSHAANNNDANPLPTGTPCWSGNISWQQETFDLSAYEGETVQIRFRFASDGYVTEEGWYVDDVNITSSGSGTGIEDPVIPHTFAVLQNVPNPFNPMTSISYQLPESARVTVEVYNVAGKRVSVLVDEHQEPGYKSIIWDGTNDRGQKVASGVYLYRVNAGNRVVEKRMVLLK